MIITTDDEIIIYLYLDLKEKAVPESVIARIIEMLEKGNTAK